MTNESHPLRHSSDGWEKNTSSAEKVPLLQWDASTRLQHLLAQNKRSITPPVHAQLSTVIDLQNKLWQTQPQTLASCVGWPTNSSNCLLPHVATKMVQPSEFHSGSENIIPRKHPCRPPISHWLLRLKPCSPRASGTKQRQCTQKLLIRSDHMDLFFFAVNTCWGWFKKKPKEKPSYWGFP